VTGWPPTFATTIASARCARGTSGCERGKLLSASGTDGATLGLVAPVVFFFPDRTRGVSEGGADFLVARLHQQPEASAAVGLAERIATESRRGALSAPGQDLTLDHEEQQALLHALKASADSWPDEDRDEFRDLQLALAFETSRSEQGDG
jgi:hypothetical protein